MHRLNARAAMMIKTVNMARSLDEPGDHEPSSAVFPDFQGSAPEPTLEI
jgi:hypothetical protein